MSNVFVYTALKTKCKEHKELNGHITTSFMKVGGEIPKLTTCVNESIATVVGNQIPRRWELLWQLLIVILLILVVTILMILV